MKTVGSTLTVLTVNSLRYGVHEPSLANKTNDPASWASHRLANEPFTDCVRPISSLISSLLRCVDKTYQEILMGMRIPPLKLNIMFELRGPQGMGVVSTNWFDRVLPSPLYMLRKTLKSTDVQSPFLGTPLVPLRMWAAVRLLIWLLICVIMVSIIINYSYVD